MENTGIGLSVNMAALETFNIYIYIYILHINTQYIWIYNIKKYVYGLIWVLLFKHTRHKIKGSDHRLNSTVYGSDLCIVYPLFGRDVETMAGVIQGCSLQDACGCKNGGLCIKVNLDVFRNQMAS